MHQLATAGPFTGKLSEKSPFLLAAALGAAAVLAGTQFGSGAGESAESVFIAIAPCRLIDTRPDVALNTGPRDTPIGNDEEVKFVAHDGSDASSTCEIPATATAIATSTVAIDPSAASYLSLYSGDVTNPGIANLNYIAGLAATPNAATVPLAGDGSFFVYNAFGTVDVVIDVNGADGFYFSATETGSVGDDMWLYFAWAYTAP